MALYRVMVLMWADMLAMYVMWIMQAYLSDVWGMDFTHAAGMMNIASGLSKVLPLLFFYFVNAGLANKWMLLLSSFSYVIGLGFFSLSTPPVLAEATGRCEEYEPHCMGHTQEALFYAALALIAVGISGHIVSLVPVFADQFEKSQTQKSNKFGFCKSFQRCIESSTRICKRNKTSKPAETQDDYEEKLLSLRFQPVEAMLSLAVKGRFRAFRSFLVVLVPVVAIFALPYIKPWSLRFGIPAVCSCVATLAFLTGFRGCREGENKPNGNRITNVFKVILAATLKIFARLPNDDQLYGYNSTDSQALPHTPGLWLLDKAAIEEGPDTRRWILCTVTEVEETKIIINMIPIWITLILCGAVSSIGSTYFVEQSKNMDPHLGEWMLPDSVLFILDILGEIIWKCMCTAIDRCLVKRIAPRVGIALATICATLCCIVAALVETKRRQVIRPMTVFWLFPQYFLLSGLDSFYDNSVTPFLRDQSPPSMQTYLVFLSLGLFGIGIMGNVLLVFVVGRVSQGNWFEPSLNKSRLDLCFWTLAGLSAVNFTWFLIFIIRHPYRNEQTSSSAADQEAAGNEAVGNERGPLTSSVVDFGKLNSNLS